MMGLRGRTVRYVLGLAVAVVASATGGAQAAVVPGTARPAIGAGALRAAVPDASTQVYAIGYNGSARVAWMPPDDGGSPITGVGITDDHGHFWTFAPPDNPVVTVTGLTNGVSYRFQVRFANADGVSPVSPLSNTARPHGLLPGGTFTATGSPLGARSGARSVRLADGRVLVVGGTRLDPVTWVSTPLATAELYDPATGTWSATGALPAGRAGFTLTLLTSGQVLLAGGYDSTWTPVASTYLYTPSTGTWVAARAMRVARAQHTATLLSDGSVLAAGGFTTGVSTTTTATAEVYRRSILIRLDSWTLTGAMPVERTRHAAVGTGRGTGERVVVIGGNNAAGGANAAAVYQVSTGTWSTGGSFVQPRTGDDVGEPSVTLLADGTILVAGGYYGRPLRSAELYDPATATFRVTGALPFALQDGHTATRLADGRVLVVGGVDDWGGLALAQLYDPVTGTWSRGNDLPRERAGHTAVLLTDGSVLVAGGMHWMPTYTEEVSALRYVP